MATKKDNTKDFIKASINLEPRANKFLLLEGGGKSINRGVMCAANMLESMVAKAYCSMNNALTQNEWRYLTMSLKGEPIKVEQRLEPELLAKHIREAEVRDVFEAYYSVDVLELSRKVSLMPFTWVYAIHIRCRDFWTDNPDWVSGETQSDKVMMKFCKDLAKPE